MKYRAIIRDAWSLTQENKKLIWWFAFLPAVLSTLVSIGYFVYQFYALWTSPFVRRAAAGTPDIFMTIMRRVLDFVSNNPGFGAALIVVAAILGLIYLMLPVFTQGALIQSVAKIRRGEPVNIAEGVSFGLSSFLPLFEYHLLIKTFSAFSVLTEAVFVFRSFGPGPFILFSWIFVIFLVVAVIFTFLFTFADYYIVLEKRPVFRSILKSSGLVIRQWHHLIFMLLLMGIISIRIVVNILFALLIPILFILPIILFASFTLTGVGMIIGGIVGLIALYFASYFVGTFHVFTVAVWTFTFLELNSHEPEEKEDD